MLKNRFSSLSAFVALPILGSIFVSGCAHHQASASASHATNHEPTATPTQMVDALNHVFGAHEKTRASHAKGFCGTGEFIPSAHAADLSSSALFTEKSVSATVRFSVGGGNPHASDKSRSVRGLAATLDNGHERYDLVLISEPAFFASSTASFVSFLEARIPDPATKKPNPDKVKAHNEKYPEAKIQSALLSSHPAPASYATTPYFSTNAFKFTNAQHQQHWARVEVDPAAGTYYLSEEQEHALGDNFLQEELQKRISKAPIEYTIFAKLAGDGDSLTNPTTVWPFSRKRVELGKLKVTALTEQGCDGHVFVPTNLPKGIEPSDDPILKARAAAYAESLGRRSK